MIRQINHRSQQAQTPGGRRDQVTDVAVAVECEAEEGGDKIRTLAQTAVLVTVADRDEDRAKIENNCGFE